MKPDTPAKLIFGALILVMLIAVSVLVSGIVSHEELPSAAAPAVTEAAAPTSAPAPTSSKELTPLPTPSPTPSPKPTPTPLPTPTSLPTSTEVRNGEIIIPSLYDGTCPLSVKAGDSSLYVLLVYVKEPSYSTVKRDSNDDWNSAMERLIAQSEGASETQLAFYVSANKTAEVDVPIGVYEIYYAAGDIWYGNSLLFGFDTRYYKAEGTFDFYADKDYYNGYTLELFEQYDGNLGYDTVDRLDWPQQSEY